MSLRDQEKDCRADNEHHLTDYEEGVWLIFVILMMGKMAVMMVNIIAVMLVNICGSDD